MQLIPGTAEQTPSFSLLSQQQPVFSDAEQHFYVIVVLSEIENLQTTSSHYPYSLRGKNKTD